MMIRLETTAQDLTARLRSATPSQQRAAALLACQLALQAAPIDMPIVTAAVEELLDQSALSIPRIAELNGLVARLDRAYFDLQERVEDEPDLRPEALHLFGQARAVSALSLAGGGDPLESAMETIYEASMAVDDASGIYKAVLLVL